MAEYSVLKLTAEPRKIDRRRAAESLAEAHVRYDAGTAPHVILRPSQPFVKGAGYLNFIGNWHYFADPPGDNAAWVRAIAPSSAGKLEIWMNQLAPGTTYLVAIDVMCAIGGPNPGFSIGASDAAHATVAAQAPDQTLLLLIQPEMDMSLVTVEPQDLASWIFFSVEVTPLH
jgi:hypothetical protein